MKAHQGFALAVRIVGLIGLLYLVGSGIIFVGFGVPWFFVIRAITCALVCIWLVRGAPQLVRFAYPDTDWD